MKSYPSSRAKSPDVQKLIDEALDILAAVEVPFTGKSPRALVQMAMSFLAVAGVTGSWKLAKGQDDNRHLKTREIITFINRHYEENISPGSYDDIRRKHLKLLVLGDLILNSADNPFAATNDPTRGYTLDAEFKTLLTYYGTSEWEVRLRLFKKNRPPLADLLARKRNVIKIPIQVSPSLTLFFSKGGHNELQREIVEEFLTRFGGPGTVLLYVGDTSNKYLYRDEAALKALGFFDLAHDELPDIVAYNKDKNWLFLIEAVHSSGAMTEQRVLELRRMLKGCTAGIVFVTAFTSRTVFKKFAADIAWETEVWTADAPDHMVHFNGSRFLGPYKD